MANPLYGSTGANVFNPTVADAGTLSGLADTVSFVREFWPTLLDRYPDRQLIENGLMAHLVDNKAFVGVQTNTTQVFHAEQDSVLNTLTVSSVLSPGAAGASATITVDAPTNFDGSTTKYYAYATVGQNFQVAGNPDIILNVTAVTPPTNTSTSTFVITVRPSSAIAVTTTTIPAGSVLLPQDGVNDPNGNFQEGTVRNWARYGVNFQYMSTPSAIVGQDTYNQAFMFQLEGGQSILAPRIFADAMMTAMLKKSAAITRGTGDTFGGLQTTVGFTTAAQTFGLTDDYAPGAVQMATLENIGIRLQNRGAGTELDLWGGYNFLQTIQANALAPLQGGAVQYISGEMNSGSGRPGLKKSLGHFILGKFKVNLNEASEWAHKAMYSPDITGDGSSLTSGYWGNAFCIIPKEQVAVPRELTNTSYTVTAPMFRILQLKAPVTTGGTPVMNQIVKRDPAHFGAMKYQIVNNEHFAAQTMLANKLYFGGTII
jgi:uncharacterized protein YidB (DUF937 family)